MASRGVNKVIIVGNLGADPETRYMPNGGVTTSLRVATSEVWKDKQTGQPQERTEWHRIVIFGRLAEIAGEYLRKGSKVYLEGSIRTRKWQDQSGQDRWTTEIVASEMQMLDSRNSSNSAPADPYSQYENFQQSSNPAPAQAPVTNMGGQGFSAAPAATIPTVNTPVTTPAPATAAASGADDFDDDIPF